MSSTASKKTDSRKQLPKDTKSIEVVLELGVYIAVDWRARPEKTFEWNKHYEARHSYG